MRCGRWPWSFICFVLLFELLLSNNKQNQNYETTSKVYITIV